MMSFLNLSYDDIFWGVSALIVALYGSYVAPKSSYIENLMKNDLIRFGALVFITYRFTRDIYVALGSTLVFMVLLHFMKTHEGFESPHFDKSRHNYSNPVAAVADAVTGSKKPIEETPVVNETTVNEVVGMDNGREYMSYEGFTNSVLEKMENDGEQPYEPAVGETTTNVVGVDSGADLAPLDSAPELVPSTGKKSTCGNYGGCDADTSCKTSEGVEGLDAGSDLAPVM